MEESEWGTPIVPVRKPNGEVRICGDYKVTLNRKLAEMVVTTPTIEDIVNNTFGSKWFSELDLTNAFHQILLDNASSKLMTISTTFGYTSITIFHFGVKQCPAIF